MLRSFNRLFSTSRCIKVADKSRFIPTSGTYPKGYKVGGFASGVKKNNNLDLSILTSVNPANAAAVFTTNKFKAAPVLASTDILKKTSGQGIQSIVINSGCANAVTGEGGLQDAYKMISKVSQTLGNGKGDDALVMSTGVIGQRLQINKILSGIEQLSASGLGSNHDDWMSCAKGIMTTDTFPKLISTKFSIDGVEYSITGMCKGAGMICPNMATLLGYLVTDAPIDSGSLQTMLSNAVNKSFNCISVDGDMSTNDTICAMANGAAGGKTISEKDTPELYSKFEEEFTKFAISLSKLVVRDGEGATKFITLKVKDAKSYEEAKKAANTVSNSALFKTAMFGKDANWGRILCAVGYSGVEVDPFKTNVSFIPVDGSAELKLLVNGEPELVDEERASEILESEDLEIKIDLGTGGGHSCEFWTCDLSHEYVTINGDYRS
ncbi:unnamed protein product [Ambrosiozyma monospora]|uniref:Arginine biosynthesis bifunctional protein ArgJ, mitochondrial n=1 Tax=Ambrosiozyma monospora TaxID=43982 RepID=A0A9W7DEH2_AMBMO|nr:unnamed protein product [Ambrosiozyma monospora]